ncbi:MAG: ATP-binding cassette domain-containing protein [Hydrogenophilaceae bacterium]|jgi:nitrate/nitrite transport system ATP-binding protein|nr:ATP-binding cassette domain-containing protein [Hydrogenophilaceae bacterium]
MAILELRGVGKSYGEGANRIDVLADVNLAVEEGECVAIIGYSGSGKTTLVSLLAGLIAPDKGEALFAGKPIKGPSPDRGVVFQSYALMPWMNVTQNVQLAVDSVFARESAKARAARARTQVEIVGLAHAADRRPAELSGGMRQRTNLARALALDPRVLILDEPLSALDALTRAKLQDELEAIRVREKKTFVLVTNDVDEALLLADRVIPLTPGPGATLDRVFEVNLPRPRDRHALNQSPHFKRLRADITGHMMALGAERPTSGQAAAEPKPITPLRLDERRPPKAYQDAARSPREERFVEFSQITKTYSTARGPLTVLKDVDLQMRKGEIVSLIGHSGCGKSTLLTMCAGLTDVTLGGVILDGREVTRASPERAVVFQAPSLMPWLTARENVMLGVDRVYPHASRADRLEIVDYYLMRVGLADARDRRADQLSNGMKQRVGLARAFALSPKLLLLDEPFGMLDSLTRWELQEVLMDVWARSQVTTICVTHDVDEAILLADRVVMMTNGPEARIGKIMKVDLPRPRTRKALLEHPRYYEYREQVLGFLEEYEHGAVSKKDAA